MVLTPILRTSYKHHWFSQHLPTFFRKWPTKLRDPTIPNEASGKSSGLPPASVLTNGSA